MELYYCNFNAFNKKCIKCGHYYDLSKLSKDILKSIDVYKNIKKIYVDCYCPKCKTFWKEMVMIETYKTVCFIT